MSGADMQPRRKVLQKGPGFGLVVCLAAARQAEDDRTVREQVVAGKKVSLIPEDAGAARRVPRQADALQDMAPPVGLIGLIVGQIRQAAPLRLNREGIVQLL